MTLHPAIDAVRGLLEPAGAPEPVAAAAVDALGADAAEQLGRNPWRVLSVPGVPPAAADALARSVDPRWRADDTRRGAALVGWLLGRAANDGHTVVRQSVVASALTGYDVDDPAAAINAAANAGEVVVLEGSELTLPRWAEAEADVADAVIRLVPSGLSVILGRPGSRLDAAVEAAGDVALIEDADSLTLEAAARILSTHSDGTRVIFTGDPDCLPPPGPGRFFGDVVASGAVPVTDVRDEDGDLARLATAVREGRLPAVESPAREIVVVPTRDAAEVLRRTVQLVSDSIPRVLGIATDDIQVVTPRVGGSAGVHALNRALEGVSPKDRPALSVHAAARSRWPAVVLVLPGEAAGALSRSLVYTAVTRAQRHLSVVHAAGSALAVAVAAPPRPRRTRLSALIATRTEGTGYSASAGSTSMR
jgi:Helix-hairpin-helix containing domain/UvrD-like helicase C-terminal domain